MTGQEPGGPPPTWLTGHRVAALIIGQMLAWESAMILEWWWAVWLLMATLAVLGVACARQARHERQ